MQKLFRWASKWWPGLIPLAVMWGFAAWNNTLPVEADLSARSSAALKETVLDKTRIAVDGRDVGLAADAFSEEGRSDAAARPDRQAQGRQDHDHRHQGQSVGHGARPRRP